MGKYNFNKKRKDKNQEDVEETSQETPEEELGEFDSKEEELPQGFNVDEDNFFNDEFDAVDNPQDEDDLEAQAKGYAKETMEPTYQKAQPKWYEKGANIVISIIIITFIVVAGLFVFREPIRGFVGNRSDDLRNLDLQGEVSDYQEGVRETLQTTNDEELEEEGVTVDVVETLAEGEYVVGVDVQSGLWVADDVLVDIYPSQQEFDEQKNPLTTNVKRVDIRTYVNLTDGQYVVVQGGELEYNPSRVPVNFNIGDTLILIEDEQYLTGQDIPEGFYTLYNTDVLEDGQGRNARQATLDIHNSGDDDPNNIGVERKTTVFLRGGLLVEPSKDLIIERVSSDGTFGDDLDILIQDTEEIEIESE